MHIAYTEQQEALQQELQRYFSKLMTDDVRRQMLAGEGSVIYRDLVRQMGQDGWLGIGWPKEFGGQSRSIRPFAWGLSA